MEIVLVSASLGVFVLLAALVGAGMALSGYCHYGAMRDVVVMGSYNRFKLWGVALGLVIVLVSLFELFALSDLSGTIYRNEALPVGRLIAGGVLLAIGIVMSQACPARILVRAGQGQISGLLGVVTIAVVVWVLIKFELLTLLLPSLSQWDISLAHSQGVGFFINDNPTSAYLLHLLLGLVLLSVIALTSKGVSRIQWIGAVLVGLGVAIAWGLSSSALSAHVAEASLWLEIKDSNFAARGMSFVMPIFSTGQAVVAGFVLDSVTLGVATIFGVILGSAAVAVYGRRSWGILKDISWSEVPKYLIGVAFMSAGAILALGCTVGQGLSGLGLLSAGSVIVTTIFVIYGVSLIWWFEVRGMEDKSMLQGCLD